MEIRARISLEVAKFKANAKLAADQFKAIGLGAQDFQRNVDKYINKSIENQRRGINMTEKEERDSYSRRMQAIREYSKQKSKLEAEAVRNTGGIRAGTNAGRPLPVTNNLSQQQRQEIERYHAWWVSSHRQAVQQQVKDAYSALRNSNSAYLASVKERNAIAARAAADRAAQTKLLIQADKAYEKEYSDWWRNELKKRAADQKAIAAAAAKSGADAQFLRMVGTFRSADFEGRLASTRYALYDVGNRFLAFGTAVEAAVFQSVKAFADFESAFTSVERTSRLTGEPLDDLRAKLIEISTTLPVAFADVSQIATLGAQMGIAADSLDEFTTTVARFSAITGLSVEETAQSFGRLAQLMDVPVSKFENLSAAVTFSGINAVATDREILRMSESIAAAANQAGFAADETIGYATALASLKVRPEEARGVLARLFREIDLSVSQGGERLSNFAKIVGTTSTEAANLWKQNPSQFVQSFLEGAQATGQLNQAISDLGITNTRELNVIQRLSQNMDLLKSSLSDSAEQFVLGQYSIEAYGKVADDFNSKLTVLQNSFAALQAKFGEGMGEALKPLMDAVTAIIKGFTSMPKEILAGATAIAAIAGAFVIFKGVMALSIAGLLAMQLAMKNLGVSAAGAGINMQTLRASLIAVTGQTSATAGAMQFLGISMNKAGVAATFLQRAALPLMILTTVGAALFTVFSSAADSAENAGKAMFDAAGGATALGEAIKKDAESGDEPYRKIVAGVKALSDEQKATAEAGLEAAVAREKAKSAIDGETESLKIAEKALADFRKELEDGNDALDTNTTLLGKNTQELILNALSKYGDGEGQDFWTQIAQIDPATEGVLNQLGFSAAEMVAQGLQEGGDSAQDYATRFQNALRSIGSFEDYTDEKQLLNIQKRLEGLGFDVTTAQIKEMAGALELNAIELNNEIEFLGQAGKATDGFVKQSVQAVKAAEVKGEAFKAAGLDAETEAGQVESASEALRRYVAQAATVGTGTTGVYDAFANLAQALDGVTGEVDILTQDGRDAIAAWSSFMQAAIEQAVADDTGFIGSVRTMASGIYALGQEGINTGLQFQQMKTYIITGLSSTIPAFKSFATSLNAALDTDGILKMIDAQIALMESSASMGAFMGKNGAANAKAFTDQLNYLKSLRGSLTESTDASSKFKNVFDDALKETTKSSEKAKTALEKLLDKIKGALKYTNTFVSLRSSLASFGESIRENGMNFNSFTEAGRSNIGALQTVINDLAEKSGGDVKKFANDLASLRKLLISSGATAADVKIIDAVLKSLGVTGKASAATIKELGKSLGDLSKAEASLVKIVEATKAIAQEVTSALDANFAYSDSIDNVTLGWEAMADAQEQAAERIAQLRQEALDAADAITEARLAIDEANASIAELTANRSKLEYQLQIAIKYGDTLRAQEISAKLAEIDADVATERNNIAEANKNIAESQQTINDVNTELTRPKTATEIINENKALRDMATRYGEMTAFMMMNAGEGEDLNKIIDDQVEAFKANAIAMGYTETQAEAVASVLRNSLKGQIDAVNQSKMELGITVDTDTATTDVNTFVNDANNLLKGVKPANIKAETAKAKKDVADLVRDINAQLAAIKDKTVTVTTINQSTGGSALGVIRRAGGGLVTGPGSSTSDSIAARLSNGEYVVKASAVKYYGTDFMNALNNMSLQSAGMSTIQVQSGGSSTVYLSPEDRALLRAAIDRPIALYTDNATIAKSANDGNAILAQRGIR